MRTVPAARTVCVITGRSDVTGDRVVHALNERGTPVVRLDIADFPRNVVLDAAFSGQGWEGTLVVRGRPAARLGDIGAVWWWHPNPARISGALSDAQRQWASGEATAGLSGVLASLDCLHVNHPANVHAAQTKPGVLAQAARCGLAVPPTWIGNSLDAARTFDASSPGGVMCKAIKSPVIRHADGSHETFYSHPVKPDEMDDRVSLSAHQFQHTVHKAYEVRLTVVGDLMFPAEIHAGSQAARQDFRADYDALTYRCATVPDRVREGVARLLSHWSLSYAALDFLIDAEGRWWLVDLNPAGQYGWIERALPELDITGALADLLTRPATAPGPAPAPAATRRPA